MRYVVVRSKDTSRKCGPCLANGVFRTATARGLCWRHYDQSCRHPQPGPSPESERIANERKEREAMMREYNRRLKLRNRREREIERLLGFHDQRRGLSHGRGASHVPGLDELMRW